MKKTMVVLVAVVFLILVNNGEAAINPIGETEQLETSVLCQKFFVVFWSGIGILVEKFGNPPGNYCVEIKEESIERKDGEGVSLRLGVVIRVKEGRKDLFRIIIVGFGSSDEEEENKKIFNAAGAASLKVYFEIREKSSNNLPL